MAFAREKITESDRAIFNTLKLKNPVTGKELDTRRWVIDRERDVFLVGLGGQGFYGCEMPAFYALVWKNNVVLLETFNTSSKDSSKDKEYFWKITSIKAPGSLIKENDELMDLIREALIAEDVGDKNRSTIKVNFEFIATPIFIQEGN